MEDAAGKGLQGSPGEKEHMQHSAWQWLFTPNRDFIETCIMAGLEPDVVRRVAAAASSSDNSSYSKGRDL